MIAAGGITMSKQKWIRILNVEDEKVDHMAVIRMIEQKGLPCAVDWAPTLARAIELLEENRYDAVLIDYMMPDGTGLDLLDTLKEKEIASVFVTGSGDEVVAVKAMKGGAYDYIIKDPAGGYLEILPTTIHKALHNFHVEEGRRRAEKALKEYSERLEKMVEERTRKLREAQEELIRKEKLAVIGLLAGSVGHELRNPLGVISNSVYYLNRKLKEADEKIKKHLNILRKEVQRGNTIISQLLDFSRMQPPSLVKGDVNSIVKDALGEIKLPENIALEWQPDENLPRIRLDPDQIGRVCQNIISNAIQAMAEGGRLKIKTRARADFIKIIFQDSGEGIPRENLAKVFEPLFTTRAKGIGLGLAIVKSLVEGHKGKIEVESEVGKGTRFTVKLPFQSSIFNP